MEQVVLKATRREVLGKQVKALRREGKLPAVIYGRGVDSVPVTLDLREATRLLAHLPSSALVTISVEGEPRLSLIREKQRDFIRGTLKHIDFQAVSMLEKLRVAVAIEIQGVSPAVKDFDGVPVTGLEELDVESFPQDLPEQIVVDVTGLLKIGDGIYVRDIVPPANVTILENLDEMIYLITAPSVEEEEEVVEEAALPGAVEPEVIEKGKKEEEEE
jgi:large subunit ribosomal protein L25